MIRHFMKVICAGIGVTSSVCVVWIGCMRALMRGGNVSVWIYAASTRDLLATPGVSVANSASGGVTSIGQVGVIEPAL